MLPKRKPVTHTAMRLSWLAASKSGWKRVNQKSHFHPALCLRKNHLQGHKNAGLTLSLPGQKTPLLGRSTTAPVEHSAIAAMQV
jgi:hypothetical protein